ncbi:G2/mitotic-specific cyclin-B3 isoform X2 [Chrysoperla carnea]|uniref:G2/mitotic-specific cyclin-B3 isoform X2 n=1 Tax=Chrysoperla carnea TaxID=189513 RepID=UPI001D07EAA8|nr:G2/mitotic-specific cyclin-B3 isoform X2 [Chrysoperla carnea]
MAPIKAPLKTAQSTTALNTRFNSNLLLRRGISTRTQQNIGKPIAVSKDSRSKRKANSPLKEAKDVKQIDLGNKRAALGDITNATCNETDVKKTGLKDTSNAIKKVTVQTKFIKNVKQKASIENIRPINGIQNKIAPITRSQINRPDLVLKAKVSNKVTSKLPDASKKITQQRTSDASEKSEDSLNDAPSKEPASDKTSTEIKKVVEISPPLIAPKEPELIREVPEGVEDFDKENWDDIFQASHYAMDIFEHLKNRESHFQIRDYISKQPHINIHMRSLLVDWMVEVQESFELNHETLYLAVKLVDMYLNKIQVGKDVLQLVGAASLFIASKYDERMPPLIDDFLYICDGAYEKRQMLKMEMNVLKNCNFEMGIPLSYRFLRRYARCAKVKMPTLTLARFILEYSLMDYTTITHSDSKLASAALYIALRMEKISGWTSTLEYYSGYQLEDFMPEVKLLNAYLHKPQKDSLSTIRNKYSHKLFFEVAKKPLITL